MDPKGQLALITGSSRGIGRATAIALAQAGAAVVINYLHSRAAAEDVAAQINGSGGTAFVYQCDVSSADAVRELKSVIVRRHGIVSILVNNAGQIIRPGDWSSLAGQQLDDTIRINLLSAINCIQSFAPEMIEQRAGAIVNVTTTYAMTGAAPVLAYTAAKAGVITVTQAMAKELGRHNVTVNAVAPGNIRTDMTRSAGEDVISWAIATTPLARLGEPEEIAESIVFLVRSAFITGHVLVVDGGQLLNI